MLDSLIYELKSSERHHRAPTRLQINGTKAPEGCIPGRAIAFHFVGTTRGVRAAKGSIFVGYLRQLCPDDVVAPLADETPGAATVEQYSLSTHSVALFRSVPA